jgi:uncharacterized membrane protein YbhN (UPF0104 family)
VFAVIIWFIVRSLTRGFAESNFAALHFDWRWLAASWVLLLGYYAIYTLAMDFIMRSLGSASTYRKAFKLNFATNPGKYVPPGVVWPAVGRAALAPKLDLSRVDAVVSLVLEAGLSSAAAVIIFVVSLGFGGRVLRGTTPWEWLAMLAVLVLCLHPAIFRRALTVVFKVVRVKQEPPSLGYGTTLGLVALYAASWLVAGAAFECFTLALVTGAAGNVLTFAGAYATATIAGMAIPGAPAGLGEREAVLTLLLIPMVGPGVAVVIAFAARVWFTLLELLLSGTALALPAVGPGAAAPVPEGAAEPG